ncbi:hypothetical protein, partial [Schaalia canis]
MSSVKKCGTVLVALCVCAGLLSACGAGDGEENITPDLMLLTAKEAGGGVQTPIQGEDMSTAADCGPDDTIYYPEPYATPYAVKYISGDRRIVLGVWDFLDGSFDFGPPEIDRLARGDYCRLGKAYLVAKGATPTTDWRVTPLDFGEGIAAFQAVYWEGKGLTPPPPEPVVEEGRFIRTAARAYGIVDDTYIMVRIDLKNSSVEPPSEEELRALWDAQVA